MYVRSAALAVFATAAFAWVPVAAQVVQGQVRDGMAGAPVAATLVLLVDEQGVQRAGGLTGGDGRFVLRAPGPGRYVLRAERIGYEPARTEPFEVSGAAAVALDLELRPLALELEGLRVEAQRRCAVDREEAGVVAALWEQAQMALRNQEWSDRSGSVRFRVTRYERHLDPATLVATSESRSYTSVVGSNPIQSRPAPELLADGFVRPDDQGGYWYFGPDAAVLLSAAFLDAHCFGLTGSLQDPDLIGLTFQPVRARRNTAGIEGTLWLEREGARLRSLEFRYTWAPWPEADGVARGRVDFEELPGGAWIVRRWWIRMPRMVRDVGMMMRGRSGLRVAGLLEVGGAAAPTVTVVTAAGAEPPGRPPGTLVGTVWDSTRAGPLAGAEVYLADDGPAVVTDAAGRFTLPGIPSGSHDVRVRHPRLDSLPLVLSADEVRVPPGGQGEVTLAVPSMSVLLGAVCPEVGDRATLSAVAGMVRSPGDGTPLTGATVTVEWTTYRGDVTRDVLTDVGSATATTDGRGRYVVCGVPGGVQAAVQASWPTGGSGGVRRAQVPGGAVVWVELSLRPEGSGGVEAPAGTRDEVDEARVPAPASCPAPGPGAGWVVGELREEATGVPVGVASVRLMAAGEVGESRQVRADSVGAFTFCDLTAGEWAVEAWLGDYRGGPLKFVVAPGQESVVALTLAPEAPKGASGSIRGRIVDGASGAPVRVAEIHVVGTARRVLSGEDGVFHLAGLEPGTVGLSVRCLGYADAQGVVRLAPGQLLEVEVALRTEAIPLDPIVVTATRRALPAWAPAGLERRLLSGWGSIMMEEEIRTRSPHRVWELLVGSPVEVHDNGRLLRMRRTRCTPLIYIDGSKVLGPPGEALLLVDPADLFAMEIYQGPAETPSQWVDSQSRCGVILLWTRRGPGGR